MKIEQLKQIIFLLEHGYYDNQVIGMANENKPSNVDAYRLINGEIVVYHDGWICGYYGQHQTAPDLGTKLLKEFRITYIKNKFPEIKKLLDINAI